LIRVGTLLLASVSPPSMGHLVGEGGCGRQMAIHWLPLHLYPPLYSTGGRGGELAVGVVAGEQAEHVLTFETQDEYLITCKFSYIPQLNLI
jgi:hypothetical protein